MFKFTLLRFNDFDDEWSTYKLSELSEQVKRKKENITDKDNILTISANKGFISQKERWDNVIAGKSLKKYTYLKKDEFSYNRGNSKSFKYGCIYRLNYENALVPNVYHSFRITNGDINFFEQLFQSKQLDKQLIKIITSTARMDGLLNISANNFFNIDVNIPNNLKEQKLIGDFLKLIDIKIELLENKYENYLNFKKYIMQQIFTQKLRFRNFNENFNEYLISQLFISKKGSGLSKDMIENDGVNKCVLYGELYTNYSEIISEVQSRTNEECKSLSKYGDILIPSSTTTKGIDLVTASVILDDDVYLGGDITILRNKDDSIVNNSYFAYYFSNGLIKDVSRLTQGSTIIHLYWKDFKKVKVMLPSLEEQEKITNILISIDEKLNEINNIIDSMKEFKKGLLQQMFV